MSFKAGASSAQHRYSDFNGLDQLIIVEIGDAPLAQLLLNYTPGGDRYLRRETSDGQLTTTPRHCGSVEHDRSQMGFRGTIMSRSFNRAVTPADIDNLFKLYGT